MCEVTLHVIHCPYSHEVLNGHPAQPGDAATAYSRTEMNKEKPKTTRRESTRITLYLLPEEKQFIDENAARLNISSNEFIRASVRGQQFPSYVDQSSIKELIKLRADLGRLGGLLKLWLTNDHKTAKFNVAVILHLLSRIYSDMDRIHSYMGALWEKLSRG